MKIVKINGGLGNQMFQYAFARSLESQSGDVVYLDPSSYGYDPAHNGYELEGLFGVRLARAGAAEVRDLAVPPTGMVNRFRRKYLTRKSQIIDRKFSYQPELLALNGDFYYEGYWQSEKYFKSLEAELRAEFAFRPPLSGRNLATLGGMPRPVASVHVRRGDYLRYPNLAICTPAYYERAIQAAKTQGAASLLVFSDDMDYCRTELRLGSLPAAFVDWNTGNDSWQDMALMARCDLHVIANSSFSWWGAWLDPQPGKKVFAPKPWNRRELYDTDKYYNYTFGDIVPDSWERVPV